MMLSTPAATLNRLSLSESDTNPVISGQLQKILQVTFGYLQTVPAISVLFKGGNSNAQNLNYETFAGTSKSNLHQSPKFNGDCYSAKYSAQQAPLKNGNSPSLPVRRNLLIKLNCAEMESANSLILSRNAQSVCREIKGEKYSCSVKPENYSGSAVIQHGCNNENQQVKSKEKGSTVNATLRDYSDGSALDFLRWRRLISPCAAAIKNPAVLSPSSLTFSMDSKSSRGNLTDTCSDLLFLLPVAITESYTIRWCSVCTIIFLIQSLTWCSLVDTLVVFTLSVSWCIHGNAPQCSNTGRASNHNVNEAYTMALQHSTQTRPKYQYLFLAVCRSDLNSKPHRESVTAHSEQDARRSLAGQFVLSFAGRVPAQGVCNA